MRSPSLQRRHSHIALDRRGPAFIRQAHGDVHILEDQPGCDAAAAVGGFNQVISRLASVFPAECIDEEQRFGKLSGFDQETRAVDFP